MCTETAGFSMYCPGRAVAEASVFYPHTEWHMANLEGRGAGGSEGTSGSTAGHSPKDTHSNTGPPALIPHFVVSFEADMLLCNIKWMLE